MVVVAEEEEERPECDGSEEEDVAVAAAADDEATTAAGTRVSREASRPCRSSWLSSTLPTAAVAPKGAVVGATTGRAEEGGDGAALPAAAAAGVADTSLPVPGSRLRRRPSTTGGMSTYRLHTDGAWGG